MPRSRPCARCRGGKDTSRDNPLATLRSLSRQSGGSDLTALQLDPYYLKKLYGKGLFDKLKQLFGKKKKEEEDPGEVERLNAEIMKDIAEGITHKEIQNAPSDTGKRTQTKKRLKE